MHRDRRRDQNPEGLTPAERDADRQTFGNVVHGDRQSDEGAECTPVAEADADGDASIPELIRRARQSGVLHPDEDVDRVTVWRAANRLGIDTTPRKTSKDSDTRRWAYPERMQLVMLDFKHFRAGAARSLRQRNP